MKWNSSILQQWGKTALNLVLPPACPVTNLPVDKVGDLHPSGWHGLRFIAEPFCEACGAPFDVDEGEGILCVACAAPDGASFKLTGRNYFNRIRSVVRYDEASAKLVLSLKNADRTELVPTLAKLMAGAGRGMLEESDNIVPVPLHRQRLVGRRFNQAAELARLLGRDFDRQVDVTSLLRIKPTKQQKGLTARQRQVNVQGAFTVSPAKVDAVRGKTIMLIDDVLTTGATFKACARALRRAGAAKVNGLVFARVVKGDSFSKMKPA